MFQKELQTATPDSSKATDASATQQATAASPTQSADEPQSSGQASQQQSAANAGSADEAAVPQMAAMMLNVDGQAPDLPLAKHAIPQEDQADFLQRMYKMMTDGQPEHALSKMEDVLK